ncbi:MAG: NUDIX domain-containing protein [Pseudaminobacter sp.]|nr:NUDIX domain-containing protein [Pseudaminobacter sp.]
MTSARTIDAVSVAIRRGDALLLVKRGLEPSRGLHAFPGGRVEPGESNEEAARRELLEETGMIVGELSPLRNYEIDATVDGKPVIYRLLVFIGQDAGGEPAGASDAEEAGFYSLAEMQMLPMTTSVLEVAHELLGQAE